MRRMTHSLLDALAACGAARWLSQEPNWPHVNNLLHKQEPDVP